MAALRSSCGHYIFALWFLLKDKARWPLGPAAGTRPARESLCCMWFVFAAIFPAGRTMGTQAMMTQQ